ncbi:MAG: peptidase T [Lachnospiraceae bacterium]|nr:peptidase T [Lachnospiraceae bacterium]
MSKVTERFLRYVKIDTRAEEDSATFPSSLKQKELGRLLSGELEEMGASDVWFDEEYGYVYGRIPATDGGRSKKTLAFISHMDTAPNLSGANVNPQLVENYDGGDIVLNEKEGIVLSPGKFPELAEYVGKTLITTDGTTLLGADDKAGVAEIMTMAEELLANPQWEHGNIAICFTPDEEVGASVDHIDLNRLGADYAYTVDGGALGELEYENFNAASVQIAVKGVNVHPGMAKNKMKNAALIAIELEQLLPGQEKPEYTEKYEGFYHMTQIQGNEEEATVSYIIRDHDRGMFEKRKTWMQSCVDFLNEKYGEDTVSLKIRDSYYNMAEKIMPENRFLIDYAAKAMEELQITPRIQPIRGGTDGARLSFMGLPCPNLCAGGHNFHGRYEYCCVESMEKIVELLKKLAMQTY